MWRLNKMVGILGKKLGMGQIFNEAGRLTPVTLIETGPCYVLQVKTKEKDGYTAIQIGFSEKKKKSTSRPQAVRFDKAGVKPLRYIREFRINDASQFTLGQKLQADIFNKGDFVDVIGTSMGKGFQGGVRRWGWSGGDQGHGSMFHRAVGSIQSGARLGRITKGHHMPGHMGADRVTIQNLEVLDVDKEKNLVVIKGCVPGSKNSLLIVRESKKRPKGFIKQKVVQASPKKAKSGAQKK